MTKDIDLSSFVGREEALNSIKRFNDVHWGVMFYRTTVGFHVKRVLWILQDILEDVKVVYDSDFCSSFACELALVHDDAEIVTGDVQLYKKERMSAEERAAHDAQEIAAIDVLSINYPTMFKEFNYRFLLVAAKEKRHVESQLVSYCDKIDGMCEALHEVFAGNTRFIGPAENYVNKRIPEFPQKYPSLSCLIPGEHPFLKAVSAINGHELARNRKPHTAESVLQPTGIPHYDRWKELTIQYAGLESLVTQKEYEQ